VWRLQDRRGQEVLGLTSFGIGKLSNLSLLNAIVAPAVESAGYRLVRLRVMGGKRKTLQVMAERSDGGMDVGDCAELSRKLSEILEAADPMAEEYVLEVSSPGIDRPLVSAEDFERFAGHEARVEMMHPIEGRRRFKGQILDVRNGAIEIETSGEKGTQRVWLPVGDVAEAKLVLTDRLIQESLKARDARASQQSAPDHPESYRR
jgi:ribosome maturation factor RimP